jgi:hypothetical protein
MSRQTVYPQLIRVHNTEYPFDRHELIWNRKQVNI